MNELLPALDQLINPEPADQEFVQKMQTGNQALRATLRKRLGADYEGILDSLRNKAPDDTIFVRDTTVPAYNFANQLLPILAPRTFIGPASAAIGPGMPLAIGVAAGSGKKTVVIHGDGGFMFHATELATAAQYQLPMVICVFDDGGYGVLRGLQSQAFEGRYSDTDLGPVNFAAMAESMGVRSFTVESLDAFDAAYQTALGENGPSLLHINMRRLIPMQGSILPNEAG